MRISDWSSDVCSSDLKRTGRVYLRFKVKDRPGVLAEIAAATRDAGVSIESMIQRGESSNGGVLVVIVTHAGALACVTDTLTRLRGSDSLLERSEEHTSELQSLMRISYAVFCLKKKTLLNFIIFFILVFL